MAQKPRRSPEFVVGEGMHAHAEDNRAEIESKSSKLSDLQGGGGRKKEGLFVGGVKGEGGGAFCGWASLAEWYLRIPYRLHPRDHNARGGDGPIVLILAPTTQHAEQIQQEGAKFVAAYNIKVLSGLYLLKHENSGIGYDNMQFCVGDDFKGISLTGSFHTLNSSQFASQNQKSRIKNRFASLPVKSRIKLSLPICQSSQVKFAQTVKNHSGVLAGQKSLINGQNYSFTTHAKLVELLGGILDDSRIVIFMDTKKGCESHDQIALQLCTDGQHAVLVHENESQAERVRIVSEFQAGKIPIMIATDVAARVLGINRISLSL
ncbi:DEAD-box ATP-dependent RNA helicase 20-like [Malus domestica]|uniref:DEAD-box ATP-dependent RNA helicase 20-like n=1 Tax=Malus domestica TaxID=3750 RepID=UPI0039758245